MWMGAGITAAALVLLLLGLSAAGVLRFGAHQSAPVLPVVVNSSPPVLTEPVPKHTEMPDDIRDWLEHLRKTEDQRVATTQQQMNHVLVNANLNSVLDQSDALKQWLDPGEDTNLKQDKGTQETKQLIEGVRPAWAKLATFFESKVPPAECKEIGDKYDQVLRETGATIGDLTDIINGGLDDPRSAVSKLEKIKGDNSEHIDKPAKDVDQMVQDICDKYKTRKWFTIHGDIGSGGMLSMPLPNFGGIGQ